MKSGIWDQFIHRGKLVVPPALALGEREGCGRLGGHHVGNRLLREEIQRLRSNGRGMRRRRTKARVAGLGQGMGQRARQK